MQRAGLLAAFVGVSLLTRGLFLGVEILDLDEAAHIVGWWELLRGRRLYADFADHKPPLLDAALGLHINRRGGCAKPSGAAGRR